MKRLRALHSCNVPASLIWRHDLLLLLFTFNTATIYMIDFLQILRHRGIQSNAVHSCVLNTSLAIETALDKDLCNVRFLDESIALLFHSYIDDV